MGKDKGSSSQDSLVAEIRAGIGRIEDSRSERHQVKPQLVLHKDVHVAGVESASSGRIVLDVAS